MKYQKRLRATTLFLANKFMRYTLHCALSSGYFSFGTYRPTTWYCDCPVGRLAAFLPIVPDRGKSQGKPRNAQVRQETGEAGELKARQTDKKGLDPHVRVDDSTRKEHVGRAAKGSRAVRLISVT